MQGGVCTKSYWELMQGGVCTKSYWELMQGGVCTKSHWEINAALSVKVIGSKV